MDELIGRVWSAVLYIFSDWDVPKIGRDVVLNVVGALAIAYVAVQWDRIRWYVTRERAYFRRMFGPGATRTREVVVVLDTFRDPRWLPAAVQAKLHIVVAAGGEPRFHKIFPAGHTTNFPVGDQPILSYASARAATYITDSVAALPGVLAGRWLTKKSSLGGMLPLFVSGTPTPTSSLTTSSTPPETFGCRTTVGNLVSSSKMVGRKRLASVGSLAMF